jgi:hypothetical protein
MRAAVIVIVATLLGAAPLRAQTYEEPNNSHKVIKVLVGASALAIGTTVAATSSNTTSVNTTFGSTETSSFSKSQLITGLVIAGTGGIVLWDGLRSHQPPRPSTVFGVAVAKQSGALVVQRRW